MAGKCYWLAAMHLCRDGLMRNVLIRDCLPALTDSGACRRPAVQRYQTATKGRSLEAQSLLFIVPARERPREASLAGSAHPTNVRNHWGRNYQRFLLSITAPHNCNYLPARANVDLRGSCRNHFSALVIARGSAATSSEQSTGLGTFLNCFAPNCRN